MFKVYGKPSCVFCEKTKEVLEQIGEGYEYIDVSQDEAAKKYLIEDLKASTVPQIFYNDTYLGGYQDLLVALSD